MALNDCAVMFSTQNWVDTSQLLVSGWGDVAGFPASNLQLPEMYRFSRTYNEFPQLLLDLGGVKPIDVIAALKVNFLTGSRWRLVMYNDQADPVTSEVHDSGWISMFPGLDLFGIAEWGYFDWGGYSYNISSGDYNRQAIYVSPKKVSARYVKIFMMVPETISLNGFAELARLWVGEGYQPTHSAVYGSGLKFIDATTIKEAESGTKHRNKRVIKKRGMRVVLENEPKLELLYRFVGPLIGTRGSSQDFLTLLEPRDIASLGFQTIYGSISGETINVSHEVWNRMSTTLDIEESI